jgi:hypothetical protein
VADGLKAEDGQHIRQPKAFLQQFWVLGGFYLYTHIYIYYNIKYNIRRDIYIYIMIYYIYYILNIIIYVYNISIYFSFSLPNRILSLRPSIYSVYIWVDIAGHR